MPPRRTIRQHLTAPVPALLGVLLWAAACDPGTVTVELPAYDPATDTYSLAPVAIRTLDDLGRLEGRATTLVGGADLVLDYRQGHMKWNDPGHPVAFSAFEADGVLIPEDFDSLAMAAAYYNIELSMLFFEDLGLPVADLLVPMKTYYWADFELVPAEGEAAEMTDNAFYMYIADDDRAFFVFPYEQFQWLPMSMNAGIMTHEYTHAIFDALVNDPSRGVVLSDPAANFLMGLNEGAADTMAAARSGDPDFMAHTVPKGVFVAQCNGPNWKEIVRDAAIPWDYLPSHDAAARSTPPASFCPYDIGAFVSSLMWSTAVSLDDGDAGQGPIPSAESRNRTARWMVGALDTLGQSLPDDFELYDFFSILAVSSDDPAIRSAFCGLLEDRYTMYYSEVQGC